MSYKKYSDKEILESYNTMIDYSGKADDKMLLEIEVRGGIEQINKCVADENIIPDEIKRINNLVNELYGENISYDKIRTEIRSDILSDDQLTKVIETAIGDLISYYRDTSISYKTVIGSLFGVIVSSFLGAIIWCYSIIRTGKMYYIITGAILIISYIIIRFFTKQSSNNVLVFLATFISAFISILLGLWFFKILAG